MRITGLFMKSSKRRSGIDKIIRTETKADSADLSGLLWQKCSVEENLYEKGPGCN